MSQVLPRRPLRSTAPHRRARIDGKEARGRSAVALAALVSVAGCGRPAQVIWARTPSAGRAASCPDNAVDMTGDRRLPTSDHIRCSFAEADHGMLSVRGTVLPADGGVLASGLPGMRVALVRVDGAGRQLGELTHATSDAQGHFAMQTRASAGQYRLVVGAGGSPPLVLDGRGPWSLAELRVLVPMGDSRAGPPRNRVR